jgi:peptidoglycan/xylan/chitin deacetylase (PgdA/CDA1 family)
VRRRSETPNAFFHHARPEGSTAGSNAEGRLIFGATGKRWMKNGLLASGALRLAGRLRGPGVVILMYHSVLDHPEQNAHTIGVTNTHSTANFRWQMEHLARNYTPVNVSELLQFLEGRKPMPRRAVAVTFDDGYADSFEVAAPVLNSLGIRAAFYLTVDCIERGRPPWATRLRYAFSTTERDRWADDKQGRYPLGDASQRRAAYLAACGLCAPLTGKAQEEAVHAIERELDVEPFVAKDRLMMTWDQVRKLSKAGHTIGSHTMTHPNVAYLGDDDLDFELAESKRKLDVELGAPVVHFAYPGAALEPIWTDRTLAKCKEVGYSTAVTTTSGVVRGHDNPLCLRRLGARRENDGLVWDLQNTFLGRAM